MGCYVLAEWSGRINKNRFGQPAAQDYALWYLIYFASDLLHICSLNKDHIMKVSCAGSWERSLQRKMTYRQTSVISRVCHIHVENFACSTTSTQCISANGHNARRNEPVRRELRKTQILELLCGLFRDAICWNHQTDRNEHTAWDSHCSWGRSEVVACFSKPAS